MPSSSSHTAGHTAESSDPQSTLVHSRNISSVSSATLHTSTTLHSQPYEPLLRPITPASGEYHDVASHQSRHSDRVLALPRWSPSNLLSSRNASFANEKKANNQRRPRRRIALLWWSKIVLQTIMAAWSIYSTARYLLAFTIYQGLTGQVFALALAAATGLSFVFVSCASILSVSQTTLLMHGISVSALVSLRSTLYYLSSCCFLGPSVANFVLLFVWRKTSDLELQTRHRCRLDVDLVWSTTYSLCNHRNRTWGTWVAISAFRLIVTLTIIIAFHLIASSPQFTPARRHSKVRYPKSKKSHTRLESYDAPLLSGRSTTSVVVPRLDREPMLQHQSSDSTLSGKSSPRNRLRNSRSQSSNDAEEGHQTNPPYYNDNEHLPMETGDMQEPDRGMNGFLDQFRLAISAITRETEEGLAFATRSDGSSSFSAGSGHNVDFPEPDVETAQEAYNQHYDNDRDDFYASAHTDRPRDCHQSYPQDEHVPMLNTYVRRMPTIESVGSRELVESIAPSSLHTNRDRRPPTRNTLWSFSGAESEFSGSEPRSRPESLSAQAELMVGMFGRANASEIGELMRKGDTIRMVDNQSANDDSSEALGDGAGNGYASTTTGSKESKESTNSEQSFQTASAGTASTMSLRTALADATSSPLPIQTPVFPQGFGRRSLDLQRPPPS